MRFDAHGDILTDVAEQLGQGVDIWNEYHKPRYAKAQVNNSIFVNFTDPNSPNQKADFDKITELALPYFKQHPDFNIVLNKDDFDQSKFNLVFGIEGMAAFTSSDELDSLYEAGYRHIGITWNEQNSFASGCSHTGGLTEEGIKLIQRCNTLGMVVDFAHLNSQSFNEGAKVTTKPILFSHGNVKALCNHVRNLDDAQLELIKASNGVIGLAVMSFFLNEDTSQASIADVVDNVLYIKENFGIDYVGFGFDFCYYLGSHESFNDVEGLHHIDDVNKLIDALKAAGLTAEELDKVCYKNMLRVINAHLK